MEKELLQTERLAVLALASQVAGGPPAQAWAGLDERGVWTSSPTRFADVSGSSGHVDASSVETMLAISPDLDNLTAAKTSTEGSDVLGAALPGLLVVNAASELLRKYSSVRDAVSNTVLQARISDAAIAGVVVMIATSLF